VVKIGKPKSYEEYLTQTGGRYIDHIYGEPLLDADREHITQTYNAYLIKTSPILEEEDRKYLIMRKLEGRGDLKYEDWKVYFEMREGQKQEAIAKGEPNPLRVAPLVARQQPYDAAIPLTDEKRQLRNNFFASAVDNQLLSEVIDTQFDQFAEIIKQDIWKSPIGIIENTGQRSIDIQADGTVKNRSQHGMSLSFSHIEQERLPNGNKGVSIKRTEELSFGIGYFGERADIVPEARGAVSDEDLEKGIKAYYIQWNYTAERDEYIGDSTVLYVIPFASDDAQRIFFEHLYRSAISTSPEKVIPDPIQRKRAARRNRKLAEAA
jgi:hypothetical protein